MEVTLKQAVILQTIANCPGITGPQLYQAVKQFVPVPNIPQHLARLKRKNLIQTVKVPGARAKVNTFYLTADGERELNLARRVAAILAS